LTLKQQGARINLSNKEEVNKVIQTATKSETTQDVQLYMHIGSYESAINKYAYPYNPKFWEKYTRLKRKILQWQQEI